MNEYTIEHSIWWMVERGVWTGVTCVISDVMTAHFSLYSILIQVYDLIATMRELRNRWTPDAESTQRQAAARRCLTSCEA